MVRSSIQTILFWTQFSSVEEESGSGLPFVLSSGTAVNFLLWWVGLVPFGKCLADFCMGFVFGLRQDKIQIESTCEADCGKDQETVGVQTFLWEGRDKKHQKRQLLNWL